MVGVLGSPTLARIQSIVGMHAAVTAVFDVSCSLQSWNWSVEAYTAPRYDYSNAMVSTCKNLQLLFLSPA